MVYIQRIFPNCRKFSIFSMTSGNNKLLYPLHFSRSDVLPLMHCQETRYQSLLRFFPCHLIHPKVLRVLYSLEHYIPQSLHVCMLSQFSCGQLFVTLWTVAWRALLSMGFSRQEHWSGLPWPPPGDLPDLGIECMSLCLLHCRQIFNRWAREASFLSL